MTVQDFFYHFYLLFACFGVITAAIGFGKKYSHSVFVHQSQLVAAAYYFFFGQAFLSTVVFITSVTFSAPHSWYLLLIIVAFGWKWCFEDVVWLRAVLRWPQLNLAELLMFAALTGLFSFHLLFALHKPTEWDEISYHFPVMKELAAGKLSFPLLSQSPYEHFYRPFAEFYGSLPYTPESAASLMYIFSIQHASSAHVLYLFNFVAFLVIVSGFLKQTSKVSTTTIATVLLALTLSSGTEILLATGLVDISAAIYQVLACFLLLMAQKEKQLTWVWLSLLCIGAAFGHKFTTAFILPVYLPMLVVSIWKRTNLDNVILKGGFAVMLGGGVWYLKNLLLHGNPVYPLYFGHRGMSTDEYQFLTQTLIDGLRQPNTLQGLMTVLFSSYKNDTGLIILSALLVFSIVVLRKKLEKFEVWLLSAGISMFCLNFLVGSQVSRYVLFLPIIITVVAAKYLNRWPFFIGIFLVLSVATQYKDVTLRTFWIARAKEIPKVFGYGFEPSDRSKIGCVADIYHYCNEHCNPQKPILNLWDAYAAVYYDDAKKFVSPPLDSDFSKYLDTSAAGYLYSNKQWRTAILSSADFHRDMQPSERAHFEDKVASSSTLVFTQGDCSLYQLQEIK